MRARALVVAGALALLAVVAGPAAALPGDAPFGPTSPAPDASVPVDPDGIPVTFSCPVYRSTDLGTGFVVFGGASDYGVGMSSSPAVGADGRLADMVALATGSGDQNVGCSALLGAGGSPPRPQETPGVYWWQVWRICTGCPGGYETGPVQKLALRSAAYPTVGAWRPFAGYPALVKITVAGVPDGSDVRVERAAGARWVGVGEGTALGGGAEAVVTLPRGRQRVRAAVTIGGAVVAGPERVVVVRPATAPRTTRASQDGAYRGTIRNRSVTLRIAAGGREVRDVRAFVPMLCPGVTAGTFTTQIGTLRIPKARIAPDGSFVRAAVVGGDTSFRVRGRLAGARVTGRVEMSLGPCVGNAAYTVRRT